jgi:hypothetical protein
MSPLQRALAAILMLLLLWGVWRQQSLHSLQAQVREEESSQRRFLSTLAVAAQDSQPLPPNPKPDTAGWLASNALRGLERRLLANTPAAGGAGAEIKLRNLKPEEVVRFLQQLTKVNLIVRRMVLSDLGSRSLWELQLLVETPQNNGKAPE